ncbi:Lsr2 family DNA-binding protein [Streptomyces sp. NPDC001415]
MRKTIQVITYTDSTVCDACLQKDGTDVEASDVLSLGSRSWDLCPLHCERFAGWLADALDAPEAADVAETHVVGGGNMADQPEEQAETEHQVHEHQGGAPEAQPSVMVAGVVAGYEWDSVREAVRNMGYRVVGRADDSTVLIVCGVGAERNVTKLRDARERGIPCMDATVNGVFKAAVRAGDLRGGDMLPEPVKKDAQAVREEHAAATWQPEKNERLAESSARWAQERREKEDAEIRRMATAHLPKPKSESQKVREWARANGYNLSERGRISMAVGHAYKLANVAEAVAA